MPPVRLLASIHRVASAFAAARGEADVARVVEVEVASATGAVAAGLTGFATIGGRDEPPSRDAHRVRAPVVVGGERLGWLWLDLDAPWPADPDLQLFLDLIAQQCGLALERIGVAEAEDRARQRLRFLVEASEVLSSSLDYRLTLSNVAVLAVPRLADGFSVDIVEPDGTIQREITTHIDATKAAVKKRLAADYQPSPDAALGIGSIIATQRPRLVADVTPDVVAAMARDDEHRKLLEQLGLRSQMAVPMRGREALVGVLTFVLTESDRHFTADDLALAEDLARRAALAVENARLHAAARRALAAEQDARSGAERAQQRLTFLLEASTLLSTSLAYPEAFQRIARLAVPTLGDLCIIDIVGDGGGFERVAAVHADPSRQPVAEELARRYPPDDRSRHPVVEAVRTGHSVWAAEVSADDLAAMTRSEENLRLVRRLGMDSFVCVPLLAQGQAIGAMTVAVGTSGRRFDREDLALVESYALRAGLALDNARLYSREHHVAATLQRSLLVEQLPEVTGLTLAARYVAGGAGVQVGGDWYDVVPLTGGHALIMVGDVVGRGLRAASVMGQLRNAARAYALDGYWPGDIASRLSKLLDQLEPGQMATMVLGRLDPARGELVYTSAGHPPGLLLGRDREARWLEGGRFVPLGVPAPAAYPEASVELRPGDTLLLYTDGLVETRGVPIDSGLNRLLEVARPLCDAVISDVTDAVVDTIVGSGGGDDVALLGIRFVGIEDILRTSLPAAPSSLAAVRALLRPWLERQGASTEEGFDLLVASGEACANAIEHAYGPGDHTFALAAWREGQDVVIEVRDAGRWRAARGTDRGRGRTIMESLTDEATLRTTTEGTTVRLRRSLRE